MRHARFLIGVSLTLIPFVCTAQETSSGSMATPSVNTGAALIAQLERLAEGALPLKDLEMTDKERAAWTAEVKRYAERSAELRARCHEEIRKANRDTIADKAAQCLRSDLMLEATHRRKQRDLFLSTAGVPADILGSATTGIDAWLDAATAIIDGVDAGVFTTVDTLKAAKRNLHATYRVPMQSAFMRVRTVHAAAIATSVAAAALNAFGEEPHPVLETFVPCIDDARTTLGTLSTETDYSAQLRAGATRLRTCIDLLEHAAD